MIRQLEFAAILEAATRWVREVPLRAAKRRPAKRGGLNPIAYTVALSSALRAFQLTHPLYDILACVAKFQTESAGGHATYPRIVIALGCTFENVRIHVSRNPELFDVETGHALRRLRLSREAIELLGKIKLRIERTYE